MSIPAIYCNAHYLFEPGVLEFDRLVEIHVSRFGHNMKIVDSEWVDSYPFCDINFTSPDSYKVFINCNEPVTSPHRERNEVIVANSNQYDLILTTDEIILNDCSNVILFPYGTTWLNKGRIDDENAIGHYSSIIDELHKSKKFETSFLSSFHARQVEGYELRKNVWLNKDRIVTPKLFYSSPRMKIPDAPDWYKERFEPYVDNPLPEDRKEILFNSQFHIAIESSKYENYFTEKLIDAIITKTVPVYWGCTNIDKFFNPKGMIIVNDLEDIIIKTNELTPETYENMLPYIEENFELAKEYASSFAERVKKEILKNMPDEIPENKRITKTQLLKGGVTLNDGRTEKILTIGILSLNERIKSLNDLLGEINKITSRENLDKVEIIVNVDDRQKSVGQKRNEILEQAKGKFVCFIDDDDNIDEDYINIIMKIIRENPELDCIGFSGMYYINGNPAMIFKHANEYGGHYKDDEGIQYRPINHLNPTRTEIARKIRFPEKNFGEDSDYCDRLLESGLLKNEIIIHDKIMYHYLWDSQETATQQGMHGVENFKKIMAEEE